MKKLFEKNITIGITESLPLLEKKKIRMVNVICFIWHLVNFVLFFEILFLEEANTPLLLFYLGMTFAILVIQFLQHKKYYSSARLLLISLQLINHFVVSNYLFVGVLLEYFYAIIPLISLHFFDNKKITFSVLITSILFFYIPNLYFHHYPSGLFGHFSSAAIFFVIFFNMKNLKRENRIHEHQLEKQMNVAIKDKEIIDQQREKLQHLNKIQSQFFTNLSHELRTPLTLIDGSQEMLKEQEVIRYNTNVSELVNNIGKQIQKMRQIVDDILDLTKMNTNEFRLSLNEIYLTELLNKIVFSFEPLFKQEIITFDYTNKIDCKINVDPIFFERALNNIILNSLKYTSEGGKVVLQVQKKNEEAVLINVIDNGIGIEKSEIKKIFNRFYQTDNDINKSKGSGIGLAFAKETINLLKGKISVESELGKGSIFCIEIPVVEFLENPNANIEIKKDEKESEHEFVYSKNFKVLLVDDNPEMRNYFITILKEFIFYEASNGVEALELLKHQNVDLIITDYMMPKMDGYEFVKNVRQKHIDLPIIAITARVDIDGKLNMLRLGLDDYITKPFNKQELKIRISNVLKNYHERHKFLSSDDSNNKISLDQNFISDVEKFIIENCSQFEFNLDNITEEFAISKSSLYRKIKITTGLSPKEFITEVKLRKARSILNENTSLRLKEISFMLGFKQPNYFSKLYEKRFGVKPIS